MKYDVDLFTKHLQGMVQIPTVSSADPDKIDKEAYLELHRYLEKTYPLVHKTFEKTVVGRVGLLYYWKGTGKSGKLPLMLTAHQDVVPEGDHAMWKYPPYSATLADGCIWGRGCMDSKNNIQAYMDALEMLIADGFVPDYDIYLGFGYNEEIMGGPEAAAGLIADELKRRGVKLGMPLDEGGGVEPTADGRLVANVGVAEKGYADFEFSVSDPGGHSAMPGKHSSLGRIGEVCCIVENNEFPQRMTDAAATYLKALAPFIQDAGLSELLKDPVGNWEELKPIFDQNRAFNAITRTTAAVTMGKGSDQANILPERSWMVANHRLLPGDTLEDVWEHYRRILPEGVELKLLKGHNPPPVQSVDTAGFRLLRSIFEEKYPGVTVIPQLVNGGTDSRFYCDLCPSDSVYRITGQYVKDNWGNCHQVNEHIFVDIIPDNVEFYVNIFRRYGAAE